MTDMTATFGSYGAPLPPVRSGTIRVFAAGSPTPAAVPRGAFSGVQTGHFDRLYSGESNYRDVKIQGTTTDPSGAKRLPIALRYWGQQGILQYGTSNESGVFRFYGLPAGTYEVLVGGAPGYRTKAYGPITVT